MVARFQYMSDLHLEMFPGFRIAPEHVRAPYLILAGDVGNPSSREYADFLTSCATLYDGVFVVLGNHEAYGKPSWEATLEIARQTVCAVNKEIFLASGGNKGTHTVRLLQNDAVDLGGDCNGATKSDRVVRVLGCTLWSDVLDDEASEVRMFMMDYRKIGGGFNVDVSRALHRKDVAWLRSELERAKQDGARAVVVTHHAPLTRGTSHPKYAGSSMNSAFSTDLSDLLRKYASVAPIWIHGHTHYCHATSLEAPPGNHDDATGTRSVTTHVQNLPRRVQVLSNQRGYASCHEEVRAFSPDAPVVEVD